MDTKVKEVKNTYELHEISCVIVICSLYVTHQSKLRTRKQGLREKITLNLLFIIYYIYNLDIP